MKSQDLFSSLKSQRMTATHHINVHATKQVITAFMLVYSPLVLSGLNEDIQVNSVVSQSRHSVEGAQLNTHSSSGVISVRSWKTLRDTRVVKQDLDFSCSAASLATLLNEFYGQSVTEEALLKAMDKGDLRASFEDMQKALPNFGFRALGYAASYEQLLKLKMPVVVYLKHRKDDHFSVLRGIDDRTVWLADPSLGNRTYSREQFLEMWETRGNDSANAALKGKILAVVPNRPGISMSGDFFTRIPKRQTAQAIETLSNRHMP